ncbi:unnamed protein product [[Candida] boidinii]|uniref:Unnamed protein product n=1 Tax=Candida boidinii TaxID=5477 RepID=A0A9W6T7G3_CANBO|nr:hypothetical protein B5S30_g4503 [[Candida] boidinii]OWB82342.1 hypothetical protein B5S33_g966 [[Candida] boidinii]GME78446.1 unnamed protein product [[Candida] boidinii]GMF97752.1 unnamed protein product [[Candida] boidinii]
MVFAEEAKSKKGVLPLTVLAKKQCSKYSHLINDIGTAPYHLVESILKKKSADSLILMEEKSPQIIPYSEPLWQSLLERDFSDRPKTRVNLDGNKSNKFTSKELYAKFHEEREKQRLLSVDRVKQITKRLTEGKQKSKVIAISEMKHLQQRKVPHAVGNRITSSSSTQQKFGSSLLQKAFQQYQTRKKYFQPHAKRAIAHPLVQVRANMQISGPPKFIKPAKLTPMRPLAFNSQIRNPHVLPNFPASNSIKRKPNTSIKPSSPTKRANLTSLNAELNRTPASPKKRSNAYVYTK